MKKFIVYRKWSGAKWEDRVEFYDLDSGVYTYAINCDDPPEHSLYSKVELDLWLYKYYLQYKTGTSFRVEEYDGT